MPIEYRDLTYNDIPAGLRLCRIAGWNQLAVDWELFLRLSPHGCRAAVQDGKVVGTQLLQEAMSILRGIPSIRLDATPQGRPVYQRLGFEDEYELCRMQLAEIAVADRPRDFEPRQLPSSLSQAEGLSVRPMKAEDLVTVGETDRRIFGAQRHEILQ